MYTYLGLKQSNGPKNQRYTLPLRSISALCEICLRDLLRTSPNLGLVLGDIQIALIVLS